MLGMANASRNTISSLLSHNKSVGIVIGGAAEAMDSRPGTNDLTLANRIGFVQLAIENGFGWLNEEGSHTILNELHRRYLNQSQ